MATCTRFSSTRQLLTAYFSAPLSDLYGHLFRACAQSSKMLKYRSVRTNIPPVAFSKNTGGYDPRHALHSFPSLPHAVQNTRFFQKEVYPSVLTNSTDLLAPSVFHYITYQVLPRKQNFNFSKLAGATCARRSVCLVTRHCIVSSCLCVFNFLGSFITYPFY